MRKISLVLVLLVVMLAACSNSGEKEKSVNQESKTELVLAIGGDTTDGFDPTTGWGMYGSPLFQSTLLTYDENFEVEYDLATDYSISDDGLLYTIELRNDVVFSDGAPLTASDVVFTFETTKESGSVVDLSNLARVEEVGDYSVVFELKKPNSTFITQLVTTGIVPKHVYDDTYNENPIGSGPYKLVQWDKEQQLIVEENPHYYGKKSSFSRLVFLFLEEDAAYAAAKAGEVDVVAISPYFADQDVAGMKQIALDTVDNRGIAFPYVPAGEVTEDGIPIGNDVTSDKAIRQAIDIGVDREMLVDGILNGFGTLSYSVADGLPWWNQDTKVTDKNIERAAQILEENGWLLGEDGVRKKDGLEAAFTLLYPSGDDVRQSLSIAVSEQLKALHIRVETKGVSWDVLGDMMHSNPVMMGWGSHDPLEMYNIYNGNTRGEGFYNINYYQNDKVDEYMKKAMHSTSLDVANEYWKKAQWDGETGFSSRGDIPWVWLVNLQHVYLINEKLNIGSQKIHPHGHGWPVTDSIAEWSWEE